MASLFSACKSVVRNNSGGTFNIGGYDIDLELYRQSDIDTDVQYGDVAFGDDDESKIVVVADDTITIPEGYTLTPDSPKKSLVIMCNNLVNNGTISMYQKAPNVLPHDYYILESSIAGTNKDIIIPAYADNAAPRDYNQGSGIGANGNNGTDRNCGSGGQGSLSGYDYRYTEWIGASGSGYAFGGGAGSGGASVAFQNNVGSPDVDTTYPMRGGTGVTYTSADKVQGGVGNPIGLNSDNTRTNNFGCGGRIIIFCINFTNNGNITVNGTNAKKQSDIYWIARAGGASGAGAVDLFYTTLNKQGTITANGGATYTVTDYNQHPGAGGNGSITLTQWTQSKVVKEAVKYFSRSNVDYLLTQMAERIKESRMGE